MGGELLQSRCGNVVVEKLSLILSPIQLSDECRWNYIPVTDEVVGSIPTVPPKKNMRNVVQLVEHENGFINFVVALALKIK